MKQLLVTLFLCISSVLSAQYYYGTTIGADAKQNNKIGGETPGDLDIRFTATKTGLVASVKLFLVYSWLGGEGYSAGDGGEIQLTLETDDGTVNHFPSGTVLATINDNNPRGHLPLDIHVYHVTYTFDSPVSLTAGNIYHIHMVNTDANPTANWSCINSLYESLGIAEGNPTQTNLQLALLEDIGSGWSLYNTSLPIYTLIYTDDEKTGQGYCEAGNSFPGYYDTISGANYKIRSNFTVSGTDRTVTKVSARLKRVSGTENLTMRLETGAGALIEEGTIAYSSIGTDMTWVTFTFLTPHTLSVGNTYHLVLSTGNSTLYRTGCVQDGNYYHGYAAGFPDGHYEKMKNGSTWADHTWGDWTPGSAFKATIYFETSEPAGVVPTVTTSAVSVLTQTTIRSGGNVTYAGGGTVSAKGVCWNTSTGPTTANNKTVDGSGLGAFVSDFTVLPNTNYHLRAYATNETGTAYGAEVDFSTYPPSGDIVSKNDSVVMFNGKAVVK